MYEPWILQIEVFKYWLVARVNHIVWIVLIGPQPSLRVSYLFLSWTFCFCRVSFAFNGGNWKVEFELQIVTGSKMHTWWNSRLLNRTNFILHDITINNTGKNKATHKYYSYLNTFIHTFTLEVQLLLMSTEHNYLLITVLCKLPSSTTTFFVLLLSSTRFAIESHFLT